MFAFEFTCLGCGQVLRFGMEVTGDDSLPEVGSFSICWACGALMRIVDPGPPAVVRLTTEEDHADMAAADVNSARQRVLDELRYRESFRTFDSREAVEAFHRKVPEGKMAIIGGLRCSKGPPPRAWQKTAIRSRCGLCRQPIWLRHQPPANTQYVGCSECIAKCFIEEGKTLA